MQWQFTPYSILPWLTTIFATGLFLFMARRHEVPGIRALLHSIAGAALWSLAYGAALGCRDREGLLLALKVQQIGISIIPVGWILFALEYTGRIPTGDRRYGIMLGLVPLLTLTLAWTNEWHRLIWWEAAPAVAGFNLWIEPGVWAMQFSHYNYALMAIGAFIIIEMMTRFPMPYRGQGFLLLGGVALPWLTRALYQAGIAPFDRVDLTPLVFPITGALFAWNCRRYYFMRLTPLACTVILPNLKDAVLLLNTVGEIVTLNPAAQALLPESAPFIGRKVSELWPALADFAAPPKEITLKRAGGPVVYDLSYSPLKDERGASIGNIYVLHDITSLRKVETALRQSQETLEERVQERTHDLVLANAALQAEIGERQQAQSALTESEAHFRHIVERLPYPTVVFNPKSVSAAVEYVNPAFSRTFGYQLKHLTDLDEWFTHAYPNATYRQHILTLWQEDMHRAAAGDLVTRELQITAKDAQVHWVLSHLVAMSVSKLLLTFEDITERRRTEERIERRNQGLAMLNRVIMAAASSLNLSAILEVLCREIALTLHTPHVLALLFNEDLTGALVVATYQTQGAPGLRGREITFNSQETRELLQSNQQTLLTEAHHPETLRRLHQMLSNESLGAILLTPLRASNQTIGSVVLAGDMPLGFSDSALTLVSSAVLAVAPALEAADLHQALRRHAETLEDMVALRTAELRAAMEQAQAAALTKSRFVSNVSHELRTPLTNIKLYINLLTNGPVNKRGFYVETLSREAERLQHLIEMLLRLSQIDLREVKLHPIPCDLNQVLQLLAHDREPLFHAKHLTLKLELAPALPDVNADVKLLEQVFTNLMTNALNYTPDGGRITVRTGLAQRHERSWVTVSVEDTGYGIGPQELPRLFERFYRGAASHISNAPGTGLGLPISQELIALHHGQLTVESQEGKGSTFTVWLPLQS